MNWVLWTKNGKNHSQDLPHSQVAAEAQGQCEYQGAVTLSPGNVWTKSNLDLPALSTPARCCSVRAVWRHTVIDRAVQSPSGSRATELTHGSELLLRLCYENSPECLRLMFRVWVKKLTRPTLLVFCIYGGGLSHGNWVSAVVLVRKFIYRAKTFVVVKRRGVAYRTSIVLKKIR
jgi:hypothetical protein